MYRLLLSTILFWSLVNTFASQPVLISDINRLPDDNAYFSIEFQNNTFLTSSLLDDYKIFSKINQNLKFFESVKIHSTNLHSVFSLNSGYVYQTYDSSVFFLDSKESTEPSLLFSQAKVLTTIGDSIIFAKDGGLKSYNPDKTITSIFEATNQQNLHHFEAMQIMDGYYIVEARDDTPDNYALYRINANDSQKADTIKKINYMFSKISYKRYNDGILFAQIKNFNGADGSLWFHNEKSLATEILVENNQQILDFCSIANTDSIIYQIYDDQSNQSKIFLYDGSNSTTIFSSDGNAKINCNSKGVFYTYSDLSEPQNQKHSLIFYDLLSKNTDTLFTSVMNKYTNHFDFFKVFQDSILLTNLTQGSSGTELYRCTQQKCTLIKDIWPGSHSSLEKISQPKQYAYTDSSLYLVMTNPLLGSRIYTFDFANNELIFSESPSLPTINSSSSNFIQFQNIIYFSAINTTNQTTNLYKINANYSNTQIMTDFLEGQKIEKLDTLFGKLFVFTNNDSAVQVYSFSDTSAANTLVFSENFSKNFSVAFSDSNNAKHFILTTDSLSTIYQINLNSIDSLAAFPNEKLVKFKGEILENGQKAYLWSTFEEPAKVFTTSLDRDTIAFLKTNIAVNSLKWISGNDSIIYTSTLNNLVGDELFKIVDDSIKLVTDLLNGTQGSNPQGGVFMMNDFFYFPAQADLGWAIYKTKGTSLSTSMHHRISSTEEDCQGVTKLLAIDSANMIYFAKCHNNIFRLYHTDLSNNITKVVKGFEKEDEKSSLIFSDSYVVDGSLVFGIFNEDLVDFWRFDPLADTVRPLGNYSFQEQGIIQGDTLITSMDIGQSGQEPHYWILRENPIITLYNSNPTHTEDTAFADTLQLKDYMTHRDSLKLKIEPDAKLADSKDVKLTHLKDFEYEIAFDPKANICGEQSINITATNRFGLSTTQTITLNIQCINDAPTVTLAPTLTLPEDSSQTYKFYLGLDDGDPEAEQKITFSTPEWDSKNLGEAKITQSNDSIFLEFSPTEHWNGSKDLILKWKDNGGTADGGVDTLKHNLKVTLKPVEDEPEFIASTDTSTMDALELNLNTLFADPDSINQDTLKFSAEITSGSAAKMDLKGDQLNITPLRGVKGQVVIQLSATDKAGNTTSQDLKINVGTTGLENFAVGSANVHVLSQGLRIETVVDSKLEIFDLQGKPIYSEQFLGQGKQYRSFTEMNLQSSQGYLVRVNNTIGSSAQIFNLQK